MRNKYEKPSIIALCYEMEENILTTQSTGTNFEEPGTGEVPVNPGEGHDPGEAFSKGSIWDE